MPKIELDLIRTKEDHICLPPEMPENVDCKITFEWEDPPKPNDWTPYDVGVWAWDATNNNQYDARRLAVRKTADLVCEAIVRELEEELKDSDWNLSYRQALEDTVDKIKCRENDDLRRLS